MNTKYTKKKHSLPKTLIMAAIVAVICLVIILAARGAAAEPELREMWVLCQPDSEVMIRTFPRRNGGYEGYLQLGDSIWTDGTERNGFLRVYDVAEGGGWVCKTYLMPDPQVIQEGPAWIWRGGKVACRKAPGGERLRWLHEGDEVILYAWCEEWAITNRGYIMTRYLEG